MLVVALCTLAHCLAAGAQPFTFALIGDLPYGASAVERFDGMLASGALKVDLSAAAADDPTVLADARDLAARTIEQVGGLDFAARHGARANPAG